MGGSYLLSSQASTHVEVELGWDNLESLFENKKIRPTLTSFEWVSKKVMFQILRPNRTSGKKARVNLTNLIPKKNEEDIQNIVATPKQKYCRQSKTNRKPKVKTSSQDQVQLIITKKIRWRTNAFIANHKAKMWRESQPQSKRGTQSTLFETLQAQEWRLSPWGKLILTMQAHGFFT